MGALFHLSTLLAEDPQQQTNNNIVISDGSDIASGVIYIGYQPAYEQIQESEVVCRYIPNLLEEAASGKSEMTIDPVVIKPSTKKLILVCDNPAGLGKVENPRYDQIGII